VATTRKKATSKAGTAKTKEAQSAARGAAKSVVKPMAVAKPRAVRAKPKAAEVSSTKRVALAVAEAALDKKAVNVEILDVAGKVDYADYVVVMSGTSDRQVNALARGIAEDVEKNTKTKCLGVEGLPGGAWVLMDFGDVVVHIFHQDVRGYYDLESLWLDAARLPMPAARG
jgi:ribosome-associated protein